jgi:tRNA pseudouridine synthase 10
VLEVREPKVRSIDLAALERRINASGKGLAEVEGLRFSDRDEVRFVKSAAPEKVYRVDIHVDGKVNKEKMDEVVLSLKHMRITQQTPVRVAHRRADLAREREIVDLTVERFDGEDLVLVVRTESGTYVKEFVHGDGGRTVPSLSALLGVPCTVRALDVIEIADQAVRDQHGKTIARNQEEIQADTQQGPEG